MIQGAPLPQPPTTPLVAPNVIAVSSGKGGVGKTWFAITLSHALAQANQRVLLFDGDLGLANVDIQLGLMPKHDLANVIAGDLTMAATATKFESGGFDVIAGQSGAGSLASLPRSRLTVLRDELFTLAGTYDRAVIDIGAGVDRTARVMAGRAGMYLVLTMDEPTSLTDAYAFIKVMTMENPGTDIRIVVNMVPSKQQGERTYATLFKACEGFLNISPPLAGIIRRDPRVPESIRNQTPLLTRHPNSDAAGDVVAIAGKLLETP